MSHYIFAFIRHNIIKGAKEQRSLAPFIYVTIMFCLLSSLDFRRNVNLVLQVQQTVAWQRVGI